LVVVSTLQYDIDPSWEMMVIIDEIQRLTTSFCSLAFFLIIKEIILL